MSILRRGTRLLTITLAALTISTFVGAEVIDDDTPVPPAGTPGGPTVPLTGADLELDIIHGVSVDESQRRKRLATLFFDQAGRESVERVGTDRVIGWYGKSAVEALCSGIPVMVHLDPVARTVAGAAFGDECPILDVDRSVESIEQAIAGYFEGSGDERQRRATNTLEWARLVHGPDVVAGQLRSLYEGLLGRP